MGADRVRDDAGLPGARRRGAARRLRELGQRATAIRLDVIEVLDEAEDHLLVQEIHRRIGGRHPAARTSVSAVYRTIDRLAELGVVHSSPGPAGAAWGLALDDHSHVSCDRCGRRVSLAGSDVRALLGRLSQLTGIAAVALDAHGTCADCRAARPVDPSGSPGR